jgi:hypothetical protein
MYNDNSPGKRFLNSLAYDWEKLIADSLARLNRIEYLRATYTYVASELAAQDREIVKLTEDIAYFRKRLSELGGAENGESIPTESHKDSESPMSGFTGVTCTTV